jgi:hypothetical protein
VDPGFVIWAVACTVLEFSSLLIAIIYFNILKKYTNTQLHILQYNTVSLGPLSKEQCHEIFCMQFFASKHVP